MKFDVLTLFPAFFESPLQAGVLGKALEKQLFHMAIHNLRGWAEAPHFVVDDAPYGGGGGMVMKPEPIRRALDAIRREAPRSRLLLMTPQGRAFRQRDAVGLSREEGLILLCGRYEGIDERVRAWVDDEYSIGDYVLTGGEYAALVIIDAVARLLPGVLGNELSAGEDSFGDGLLEYPHYTRPAEFDGIRVPEVLQSGNHAEIARWRRRERLRRTLERRPELLDEAALSTGDRRLLAELRNRPEEKKE
ncbi:MAG: tRNA (guanosine(37)-N1)-methyltransferase TrmD [Deltaproteobacteria bacterium]|nr:tRNA (guanosine(37)-N1)-methyltransferase TrmD [Deltaproteobacteria bacterium]